MINSTAKVTFSRPQGARQGDCIHIEITDAPSGCLLCELYLPLAEFAAAITGLSRQDAELEFNEGCPVGKKREIKDIEFRIKLDGYRYDDTNKQLLNDIVKPHEVDGWMADSYSMSHDPFNGHKSRTDNEGFRLFKISFTRYV